MAVFLTGELVTILGLPLTTGAGRRCHNPSVAFGKSRQALPRGRGAGLLVDRRHPMIYRASGKQLVVRAARGHESCGTPAADALVVFRLD